jgi:hypothetical protein
MDFTLFTRKTKMTVSRTEQTPTDEQIISYMLDMIRALHGEGLVVTDIDHLCLMLRGSYPTLRKMFGQNPDSGGE